MTTRYEDYDWPSSLNFPESTTPATGIFFGHVRDLYPSQAKWTAIDQSDFMVQMQDMIVPTMEQHWSLENEFKAAFGYAQKVSELCHRLEGIEAALISVVGKLERAGQPRLGIWVPLTTLAPEPFELLKPLTVVVSPSEDGFEAGLYDLDLFASGDTESEAVANLKSLIIETFDDLERLGDSKLGPGPLRQKRILATIVRRT